MLRMLLSFIGLLALLLLCGCSDDSAPALDSAVADSGEFDVSGSDGVAGDSASDYQLPDADIGDNFALVVPAGTQACTMFRGDYQFSDAFHEYAIQGRVTFKPGVFVLPRDQASINLEWMDKLELGPNKEQPTATAAGTFTRVIKGTPDDGTYEYQYEKPYQWQGKSYTLRYTARFQVSGGVAAEPKQVIDEALLASELNPGFLFLGVIGTGADYMADERSYLTCNYPTYNNVVYTVQMEGGASLVMEVKDGAVGMALCKVCPVALTKAVYTKGADSRTVTDFFRLAYSASHHNWEQKFVIVFDQPLSGVHGLYLQEASVAGGPMLVQQVDLLDAQLNKSGSVKVTSYTH